MSAPEAAEAAIAAGMVAGGTFINDKAGMAGVDKKHVAKVRAR